MRIIDTSVAFKWFSKAEEQRAEAKELLLQHLQNDEQIVVPDLFFYEITNAWATKSSLTANDVQENLLRLQTYELNTIPVTFSLLQKATELTKKYRVSVYDATYAVIAQELESELITADEKFVKALSFSFVKLLE